MLATWSTSLRQMTKGVSTEVDGLASLIIDDFRNKSLGTGPLGAHERQ